MANFENPKKSTNPSANPSLNFYNWYSLLRLLNADTATFRACLVTENGERVDINSCDFTIENVHYALVLQIDNQVKVILPINRIEVITETNSKTEDCSRNNEGLTLRLLTYLDQLAKGGINKINFFSQNGQVIELTKK